MKSFIQAGGRVCIYLALSTSTYASVDTNGPNGINSAPLRSIGLSGSGVGIGMVEAGRPGKPGYDEFDVFFTIPK
jgi:hypothetical protein